MNMTLIYTLMNAAQCLAYLLGAGAGVFMLVRKKTVPGILALAGFVLFGISEILYILFYTVFYETLYNMLGFDGLQTLSTVYSCVSGLFGFLAIIAIIVALVLGVMPKKETTSYPSN
jgi:hypothetical protein